MNNPVEVIALVEGLTEKNFIESLVAPWLARRNVFITPTILTKPGQKGGDVKFSRARRDIGKHLKQRDTTYLTLFMDYYGIKSDWPGCKEAKKISDHRKKAEAVNTATAQAVVASFEKQNAARRFIPYIGMHEFEALLFSAPPVLARHLGIKEQEVQEILAECGEPEKINDSSKTAPSKRLDELSAKHFKKTTTGIAIASETGLPGIRGKCPLFDAWLKKLETLRA